MGLLPINWPTTKTVNADKNERESVLSAFIAAELHP
jgi:hypothetical protein